MYMPFSLSDKSSMCAWCHQHSFDSAFEIQAVNRRYMNAYDTAGTCSGIPSCLSYCCENRSLSPSLILCHFEHICTHMYVKNRSFTRTHTHTQVDCRLRVLIASLASQKTHYYSRVGIRTVRPQKAMSSHLYILCIHVYNVHARHKLAHFIHQPSRSSSSSMEMSIRILHSH